MATSEAQLSSTNTYFNKALCAKYYLHIRYGAQLYIRTVIIICSERLNVMAFHVSIYMPDIIFCKYISFLHDIIYVKMFRKALFLFFLF
jgi:hypothetical protein